MRETGRTLAAGFRHQIAEAGTAVEARAAAASRMLNEEFGAVTTLERTNGAIAIRGHGCPLAALTRSYPGVCLALESFLTEVTGTTVTQCCRRDDPPQCCFEVPVQPKTRLRQRSSRERLASSATRRAR